MGMSSMKQLVRRQIQRKQFGTAITSSQIVGWGNEFLRDVLPFDKDADARVISYKDGFLKIVTKSGSTTQYLKEFEEELRNRMMEKFQDTKLEKVIFQINRALLEELL
ncbi:hypothetical protein A2318_01985 [Candidatus Uhrbacteria bacterium RIFOXYB2_FULL_45_11]|uniref:DUF721 domain-containing protein n=1 Tax=Candidatus Uhrbacteria bacterium RIFOXYB2_FULL_45_11 TaxID=1802421 RepID=A0A1F7W7D6_9BACT|nr:MAG: hypothetical protein A2318_01985 [Candidatus Uhrbacteria bacterium RIFOXYB2_FULL_45_11]